MFRTILLSLSVFFIFFSGKISAEGTVNVSNNFPAMIKAGDEFTVTFNVHNELVSGFARLQYDLPEGFTAQEVNTNGADFVFENHSAKFIWIKLPASKDFTVSCNVKTENNLSGHKIVNGIFVYLKNGKTERITLDPVDIRIDDT